jgi:energy-coupling factor transporter ATP-binding protein EcfA2
MKPYNQSEKSNYSVRLSNGRPLPLKVITRLKSAANRALSLPDHHEVVTREADFARFPDGTVADLVGDSSEGLTFVVLRDGKPTLHRTLQDGVVTLVPPKIHKSIFQAVCFPRSVQLGCTPSGLLTEIDESLEKYIDVDRCDRRLVGFFVLSSWFNDLCHVAPYLWIVGPYGCGKTTLVRILSALCRRSVSVADISPAGLYALSDCLHCTLLLDDFEYTNDSRTRGLLRLMRNGSTAGQRVFRASRAYDVFGPKIIASREAPSDGALKSRGLLVVARPESRDLLELTPRALAEIQRRLQPKLMGLRLENYARAMYRESTKSASSLTPRIRDIFRSLALPLMGDVGLEEELLEILKPHNCDAVVERHCEPEFFVMAAVFSRVHIRVLGYNAQTVKELTQNVADLLQHAGEPYRLTPRKVGAILGSLGFRTQKLGSSGRGLKISKDVTLNAHVTAKRLGIHIGDLRKPLQQSGFANHCRLCYEHGLLFDTNGKELPYDEAEEFVVTPQNIDPFEHSGDGE